LPSPLEQQRPDPRRFDNIRRMLDKGFQVRMFAGLD